MLSFNNISSFPQNLPSSIRTLDLSENKISKIEREDLCNLTNLHSLDLQWNCQRCDHALQACYPCKNNSALQLVPGVFDCLHNLSYLNLRGNSLHTLHSSLFGSLTNLSRLVLSDNFLNLESETFFSALTKVKVLNLDFNFKPYSMYDRLVLNSNVAKMKALERITIVGYFFNVLDEEGIRPLLSLPNLRDISLRTNFILKANLSMLFRYKPLRLINLSENLISFQEHEHGQRQVIHPPLLDRGNQVEGGWMYSHCFEGPNQVEAEEIEYQQCWQYNHSVDLSFNNIGSIFPDEFLGMDEIECLNMSYNYINQRLNGTQFGHLKSLRHLDLSYNRFDIYYYKALSELPKLRILNMEHNEYQFMMKGVNHRFNFLGNLKSLVELNLNHNLIGLRITRELKSDSLEKLLFRNNELGSSWQYGKDNYLNIFTNLLSLKILDISYNQLPVIPNEVLENLPESLQKLNLSHNQLYSFHWNEIAHLRNLTNLDLGFNALTKLCAYLTESKIIYLNLTNNKISFLDKDFFDSFSELKQLTLSNNLIQAIHVTSFPQHFLQKLHSLNVNGNPFQCTCEAYWFIKFLMETTVTVEHLSTGMKCDSPDSLRGRSLLSMDPQSCQELYGHLYFIWSSILVISFMVITTIWKLFSWNLWYTGHLIMATLRSYTKLRDKPTEDFDAFIAFNTKNSAVKDWVYHELLVQLESSEGGAFTLCLEERDWLAGRSSIENLYDAIYRSKKTVFIITREWFNCGLLRHAFFMSNQRLLDEKKDVVVLVILDHKMKMSQYFVTRKRLCPKSFLNWPRNPKAHSHFWHMLRKFLRQDSRHCCGSQLRKYVDK
ncbi:hypothetical protein XELAEV_18023817mg [Xenopus laevis]|nr:hypothetical protein XELAEV_18023817mg [Xenopus laevis]